MNEMNRRTFLKTIAAMAGYAAVPVLPMIASPAMSVQEASGRLADVLDEHPYLMSPAALAIADTMGHWKVKPHLAKLNRALIGAAYGDIPRLGCHMPMRHGKTLLASTYNCAWNLILFPWKRIVLGSHSELYSASIGAKVKEIVERWGTPHGVELRRDRKSKDEWHIINRAGFDGGMVSRGWGGGIAGRGCDMLVMDDVIKDAADAESSTISEAQWNWYCTIAYGRLAPKGTVTLVTTRWVKNDLPGRIYEAARKMGVKWHVLKFKALAEENDILGRKPGEALCEDFVTREEILVNKAQGGLRWFHACWQQEPVDETGAHFRPNPIPPNHAGWPRWTDGGDTWQIPDAVRKIFLKEHCTIIVGIDIATSKKKTSDYTAFVVAAITPDWRVLILDVVNDRIRLEDVGERLAQVCRTWRPNIVAGDDDNLSRAMLLQYRLHRDIPEVQCLPIKGKAKIIRAQAAIIQAENNRFLLPKEAVWLDNYTDQLSSFTGIDDAHDDMVDATGIIARKVNSLRGDPRGLNDMAGVWSGGKTGSFS